MWANQEENMVLASRPGDLQRPQHSVKEISVCLHAAAEFDVNATSARSPVDMSFLMVAAAFIDGARVSHCSPRI